MQTLKLESQDARMVGLLHKSPRQCANTPGPADRLGVDMPDITPSRPTSVYRCYDVSGILIYVGITNRAARRGHEHAEQAEWWPFSVHQTVEHYASRPEAERRERELIVEYRPPFNKQLNVDHEDVRWSYLRFASERRDAPFLEQYRRVSKHLPLRVLSYPDDNGGVILTTDLEHATVATRITPTPDAASIRIHEAGGGARLGRLKKIVRYAGFVTVLARMDNPDTRIHGANARLAMVSLKKPERVRIKSLEMVAERGDRL